MATRSNILATLSELLPELRSRFGVQTLSLFGSAARDECGPQSDIDVMVAFRSDARVTLMTLAGLASHLEDALGGPVDLVEDHPRLRPQFRDAIAGDLYRVA